ncbi:ribosomal RNA-processing protein 7 homolog A [Leguminivora glycinivorella]|uniref:ribosomal RNA-processing protein 7 homolog A n=1 Tax=Leguminivora glycinivorella TaxID=1035111 RepID=UPI00200D23EC|nr:ribosomal RNA-processing protein 7 homolog A [Leguminivora glycinivorella]
MKLENEKMKSSKRPLIFKALELKVTDDSESPHTIYIKEHAVRDHTEDRPQGRTLFVVNIPPYIDDDGIKNAFREAGTVKSVSLLEKPGPSETKTIDKFLPVAQKPMFKVGYVVFAKVAQLDKALALTELAPVNSEKYQIKCGMQKWVEEYNNSILQAKELKEKVEVFMKKHDEKTKKAEDKEKKLEEEDDDGWITVTKKGKVQSFARSEKVESKVMAKEEKNKKRKELKNFYTFQIRESKMKHVVALRQKFEEDKKKIAQIKQSRRFKPF